VTSNSASQAKVSWALRDWCLALALIVVVPAIYLPYAFHNLPVAAHVDEQTSLLVLKHFHDGSLNPQFFMYPTLYYDRLARVVTTRSACRKRPRYATLRCFSNFKRLQYLPWLSNCQLVVKLVLSPLQAILRG
jgi:hypothetical protein